MIFLNNLQRKARYLLLFFPIASSITNWYALPLLYFNFIKFAYVTTKTGYKLKISHYLDLITIKEILLENDYSLRVKDPKTIIDIGGNIGTFSILASKKYPKAKILTYEPAPQTFSILKTNLKLNKCSNVIPFQLGLSSKIQPLSLYIHSASGLSSTLRVKGQVKKTTIRTTTLRQLFSKNNITACDFLKIDCEGAEYDILLKSPDSILKKVRVFSVEYHDHLTKPNLHPLLVKRLRMLGYKTTVKKHPLENSIGIIYASKQ